MIRILKTLGYNAVIRGFDSLTTLKQAFKELDKYDTQSSFKWLNHTTKEKSTNKKY